MNYNTLMNKPTINYRELIGDNTVTEVGGITEEQFNTLLTTDLSSYYTKEQIDDLFLRSYVYREKSGSIVTFDCPASVNGIDKVVSEIVAVQSGTGDPSPTNVRPISGWSAVNVYDTGKNIFNIDVEHTSETGVYTYTYVIKAKPNTNYTMSSNAPQTSPASLYFNGGNTAINGVWDGTPRTFTSDENGKLTAFVRFNISQGGIDLYTAVKNGTYYIQLEEGTTATEYEPFGTTYTIQLGDTYYGATLDVVSGVLTVTLGKIIVDENTNVKAYGGWRFYFDVPNFVSPANNVVANIICDKLSTRAKISMPQGNSISAYDESGARMIISVSDTITTVEDMNAWLSNNPITIVYELATPITIQLTPTAVKSLLGTNNIWADSGDITVKALDKILQG